MVTTEAHQTQDLLVPTQNQELQDQQDQQDENQASPSSPPSGLDPEKMSQGPVNAITVLTLLDKLVNMLDIVQENQHKMEGHQMQMDNVIRGIQADMTKLSKSHSHTSNTVSKLLDKSRKLSVTMKEVRERMETQGAQVKKLEANHAHLVSRNNFKVLIFQEENEIPTSVFVKDPPPFPRDEILKEEDSVAGEDGNRSEAGLHTVDLSSDEDFGLEAEQDDEEPWHHDLENMEKSRAEKLKRSSMKKVDSLRKAMTKIGTKIVSADQREKIKQKTSSLKVSHLTFNKKKNRSSSESQLAETSSQIVESIITEADVQVSPLDSAEPEVPFTEVHAQLAPTEQEESEKNQEEDLDENTDEAEASGVVEVDLSVVSEGVSENYALSSTLPQVEKEAEP